MPNLNNSFSFILLIIKILEYTRMKCMYDITLRSIAITIQCIQFIFHLQDVNRKSTLLSVNHFILNMLNDLNAFFHRAPIFVLY